MLRCLGVLGLCWAWPTSRAFAEVMDKELSALHLWVAGALGALVGSVVGRYRPWLCLVTVPLLLLPQCVSGYELSDPSVGPAILEEAGWAYPYHVVVTGLLVLIGHALGLIARCRPS